MKSYEGKKHNNRGDMAKTRDYQMEDIPTIRPISLQGTKLVN